jgi:hypothetical protein
MHVFVINLFDLLNSLELLSEPRYFMYLLWVKLLDALLQQFIVAFLVATAIRLVVWCKEPADIRLC